MKKKSICLILVMLCGCLLLTGCNSSDYKKANSLLNEGKFDEAREMFISLGDYENSRELAQESAYQKACSLKDDGKLKEALALFDNLNEYKDSVEKINQIKYKPLPDKDFGGYTYHDVAKAFGLDENLCYITFPQNKFDYINNFLYCYLTGDWEFDDEDKGPWNSLPRSSYIWMERLGSSILSQSLNATFLGEWSNCFNSIAYLSSEDGKFYIYNTGVKAPFTKDEMVQHIFDTYEASLKVHEDFWVEHTGQSFETELALAKEYWAWLDKYFAARGYEHGTSPAEDKHGSSPEESIWGLIGDGAYNLLVNNWGECGSHSAVFSILMQLEGIVSFDVSGHGHFNSVFIADGKYYLSDWNNMIEIQELNDPKARWHFTPQEDGLHFAERVLLMKADDELSKILGVCSHLYFKAKKTYSNDLSTLYDLQFKEVNYQYPDFGNIYVPWITDGTNAYRGKEFEFCKVSEENEPVEFKASDLQNLKSQKIYLLTKDLSDMVETGELSFKDAVEPYEKAQIEFFRIYNN